MRIKGRILSGLCALSVFTSCVPLAVFAKTTEENEKHYAEPLVSIVEGEEFYIKTTDLDGNVTQAETPVFSTVVDIGNVASMSNSDIKSTLWIDSLRNDVEGHNGATDLGTVYELNNKLTELNAGLKTSLLEYRRAVNKLNSYINTAYTAIGGADSGIATSLYAALSDDNSTIRRILEGREEAYVFIWGNEGYSPVNAVDTALNTKKLPTGYTATVNGDKADSVIFDLYEGAVSYESSGETYYNLNGATPMFPSREFVFQNNSYGGGSLTDSITINVDYYQSRNNSYGYGGSFNSYSGSSTWGNSGADNIASDITEATTIMQERLTEAQQTLIDSYKAYASGSSHFYPSWYSVKFVDNWMGKTYGTNHLDTFEGVLKKFIDARTPIVTMNAAPILQDTFISEFDKYSIDDAYAYYDEAYNRLLKYYSDMSSLEKSGTIKLNHDDYQNYVNYWNNYYIDVTGEWVGIGTGDSGTTTGIPVKPSGLAVNSGIEFTIANGIKPVESSSSSNPGYSNYNGNQGSIVIGGTSDKDNWSDNDKGYTVETLTQSIHSEYTLGNRKTRTIGEFTGVSQGTWNSYRGYDSNAETYTFDFATAGVQTAYNAGGTYYDLGLNTIGGSRTKRTYGLWHYEEGNRYAASVGKEQSASSKSETTGDYVKSSLISLENLNGIFASGLQKSAEPYKEQYVNMVADHSLAVDTVQGGMDFFLALAYFPSEWYGGLDFPVNITDLKNAYSAYETAYKNLASDYKAIYDLITSDKYGAAYALYSISDGDTKYDMTDMTNIGVDTKAANIKDTASILKAVVNNDWSILAGAYTKGKMAEVTPYITASSIATVEDGIRGVGGYNPAHSGKKTVKSDDLEKLKDLGYFAGDFEVNGKSYSIPNTVELSDRTVKVWQVNTLTDEIIDYGATHDMSFDIFNNDEGDVSIVLELVRDNEYESVDKTNIVAAEGTEAYYDELNSLSKWNDQYKYIVEVKYLYANKDAWLKDGSIGTIDSSGNWVTTEIPEYAISEYYESLNDTPTVDIDNSNGIDRNTVHALTTGGKLYKTYTTFVTQQSEDNTEVEKTLSYIPGIVRPISFTNTITPLKDVAEIYEAYNKRATTNADKVLALLNYAADDKIISGVTPVSSVINDYVLLRYTSAENGSAFTVVQRLCQNIEQFSDLLKENEGYTVTESTGNVGYSATVSPNTIVKPTSDTEAKSDLYWNADGTVASRNSGKTDEIKFDMYQWVSKSSEIDGIYLFNYGNSTSQKAIDAMKNDYIKLADENNQKSNLDGDDNTRIVFGGQTNDNDITSKDKGVTDACIKILPVTSEVGFSDWLFGKTVTSSDVYVCMTCGALMYHENIDAHFVQREQIETGWWTQPPPLPPGGSSSGAEGYDSDGDGEPDIVPEVKENENGEECFVAEDGSLIPVTNLLGGNDVNGNNDYLDVSLNGVIGTDKYGWIDMGNTYTEQLGMNFGEYTVPTENSATSTVQVGIYWSAPDGTQIGISGVPMASDAGKINGQNMSAAGAYNEAVNVGGDYLTTFFQNPTNHASAPYIDFWATNQARNVFGHWTPGSQGYSSNYTGSQSSIGGSGGSGGSSRRSITETRIMSTCPGPFVNLAYWDIVLGMGEDAEVTETYSVSGADSKPVTTTGSVINSSGNSVTVMHKSYNEPGVFEEDVDVNQNKYSAVTPNIKVEDEHNITVTLKYNSRPKRLVVDSWDDVLDYKIQLYYGNNSLPDYGRSKTLTINENMSLQELVFLFEADGAGMLKVGACTVEEMNQYRQVAFNVIRDKYLDEYLSNNSYGIPTTLSRNEATEFLINKFMRKYNIIPDDTAYGALYNPNGWGTLSSDALKTIMTNIEMGADKQYSMVSQTISAPALINSTGGFVKVGTGSSYNEKINSIIKSFNSGDGWTTFDVEEGEDVVKTKNIDGVTVTVTKSVEAGDPAQEHRWWSDYGWAAYESTESDPRVLGLRSSVKLGEYYALDAFTLSPKYIITFSGNLSLIDYNNEMINYTGEQKYFAMTSSDYTYTYLEPISYDDRRDRYENVVVSNNGEYKVTEREDSATAYEVRNKKITSNIYKSSSETVNDITLTTSKKPDTLEGVSGVAKSNYVNPNRADLLICDRMVRLRKGSIIYSRDDTYSTSYRSLEKHKLTTSAQTFSPLIFINGIDLPDVDIDVEYGFENASRIEQDKNTAVQETFMLRHANDKGNPDDNESTYTIIPEVLMTYKTGFKDADGNNIMPDIEFNENGTVKSYDSNREKRGLIGITYVTGYYKYNMEFPQFNKVTIDYSLAGTTAKNATETSTVDLTNTNNHGSIVIGTTGAATSTSANTATKVTGVKNTLDNSNTGKTYTISAVPVIYTGSTVTAGLTFKESSSIKFDSWVLNYDVDMIPEYWNDVDLATLNKMGITSANGWLDTYKTNGKYILTADIRNSFGKDGVGTSDVKDTDITTTNDYTLNNGDGTGYTAVNAIYRVEIRNAKLSRVWIDDTNYVVLYNESATTTDAFKQTSQAQTLKSKHPALYEAICEMKLVEYANTLKDNLGSEDFTTYKDKSIFEGQSGVLGKTKTVVDVVNGERSVWGQLIDESNPDKWYSEDCTVLQIEHYTKTMSLPASINMSWKIPVNHGVASSNNQANLFKNGNLLGKVSLGVRFGTRDYTAYNLIGRAYDDTADVKYSVTSEPYVCFKISNASVNDR